MSVLAGTIALVTYSNPKCYAGGRGGCSTKMSGEHYLSESVLLITTSGSISPDPAYGMAETVGVKSFKAKVLCTNHNSGLTHSDTAAAQVFGALKRFVALERLEEVEGWVDDVEHVSGNDFQTWLAKTVMTHSAAGIWRDGGEKVQLAIGVQHADLLLGRVPWPDGCGLYLVPGESDPYSDAALNEGQTALQPISINSGQVLGGGFIQCYGLAFALTFFPPDVGEPGSPFESALYQPSAVDIHFGSATKTIQFHWDRTDLVRHRIGVHIRLVAAQEPTP